MNILTDYSDWRKTITGSCGLNLSRSYCRERIDALQDPSNKSTQAFEKAYGKEYLDQVLQWFARAESEASQ